MCFCCREVHSNGPVWDDEVLADPEIQDAIDNSGSVTRQYEITNVQRSAFGRVAGAVARQHGDRGFAGSLDFVLRGSGGQSFGCFLVSGAVQLTKSWMPALVHLGAGSCLAV
jgi:glutamate synthase (ferredoxin)